MKKVFILIMTFLFMISCENNVIISYNPESFKDIQFVKFEKIDQNSNLVTCEEDVETNSYYVYFILKGSFGSPITPDHPSLGNIEKEFEIKFLEKSGTTDPNIQISSDKLEFVENVGTTDKTARQNLHFLMDFTKTATEGTTPSLSGGITSTELSECLTALKSFSENAETHFNSEKIILPTNDFFGFKFSAFTSKDVDEPIVYPISRKYDTKQQTILSYLNYNSAKTDYKSLYTTASDTHRKLYDSYDKAVNLMIEDTSNKNKNLIFLVSGYEEGFYETNNELATCLVDTTNKCKSVKTESDMFTLAGTQKIPVFIGANRNDTKSFPTTDGKDKAIDKKFRKLACITNGAYFSEYQEGNEFKNMTYNDMGKVFSILEHAVFGVWRVKINFENTFTEKYEGKIKIEYKGGDNNETSETLYKIVK